MSATRFAPAAPSAEAGGAPGVARNTFLDAIRTIAILRVIAWHTYGYAWISYVIASMPAMFFVAGSLMAGSLERASGVSVLARRFRRLLIPLWVFALVALTVMLAYERHSASAMAEIDDANFAWWIFPAWDPQGSEWGITWWASLWYLRCLAWLLVASPLLLRAWKFFGWPFLVLPLAAVAAGEILRRDGNELPWQFDDFSLYTIFWVLGFAYHERRFERLGTGMRAGLCVVFAGGAAAWAASQGVPGDIVNASYPLHLLVGLGWLMGALTFEEAIASLARRGPLRASIYWVNERALTIYLWHAAGLFVMYQLLWTSEHSGLFRNSFALPIVLLVTFLAAVLVGWLEDIAGNRRPRIWPRAAGAGRLSWGARFGIATPALSALAAAAILVGAAAIRAPDDQPAGTALERRHAIPPSGVGLQIRTSGAQIMAGAPQERVTSGRTSEVTSDELQAETEDWLREWQLGGVNLTLLRHSGEGWTTALGSHVDGSPFVVGELYDTASITKTFTAAIILQLAERGLLSLDDPLSRFVPDFAGGERIPIRTLIQHTSGLIATDGVSPYEAIEAATQAGLQFEPGTAFAYSSPGYYLLGLVIEQVLSVSYAEALHQYLLEPLGLASTVMDEEISPLDYSTHPYRLDPDGYEGVVWSSGGLFREIVPPFEYHGLLWSSAGVFSTTSDLARWGIYLWGSDRVVSPATREAMTTFLPADFQYAGLATYPYCPCWWEDGRLKAERWGHLGLTGALEYDPVDQVSFAVSTTGTVVDENVIRALDDLSLRLRRLIRGRPMPLVEPGSRP